MAVTPLTHELLSGLMVWLTRAEVKDTFWPMSWKVPVEKEYCPPVPNVTLHGTRAHAVRLHGCDAWVAMQAEWPGRQGPCMRFGRAWFACKGGTHACMVSCPSLLLT